MCFILTDTTWLPSFYSSSSDVIYNHDRVEEFCDLSLNELQLIRVVETLLRRLEVIPIQSTKVCHMCFCTDILSLIFYTYPFNHHRLMSLVISVLSRNCVKFALGIVTISRWENVVTPTLTYTDQVDERSSRNRSKNLRPESWVFRIAISNTALARLFPSV